MTPEVFNFLFGVVWDRSMEVFLPKVPEGYDSLPHWLSNLTDYDLRQLLRQGDSQKVRELSLALITVLNEVRPFVHLLILSPVFQSLVPPFIHALYLLFCVCVV